MICDICDRDLVNGECPECSKDFIEALFGGFIELDEEDDDEPDTLPDPTLH